MFEINPKAKLNQEQKEKNDIVHLDNPIDRHAGGYMIAFIERLKKDKILI